MDESLLAEQRELAHLALEILANDDFALAGSSAIREYGLIARPTEDVDLFMASTSLDLDDPSNFSHAGEKLITGLKNAGYDVSVLRQSSYFLNIQASRDGVVLEMDLGVDYRQSLPTYLEIGPVLAIEDAVGNKVAAAFSREEPRDFLDLDSIRQSGRFTDSELLALAAKVDGGFTPQALSENLRRVSTIPFSEVERYGISETQFESLKERLMSWGSALREKKEQSHAMKS